MRPFALFDLLFRRLDVGARRVAVALISETPIDENGRYNARLRSGGSAWSSTRIGPRWRRLTDALLGSRETSGESAREVSGLLRSVSGPGEQRKAAMASKRDAAA
jgi:hypothetical protein